MRFSTILAAAVVLSTPVAARSEIAVGTKMPAAFVAKDAAGKTRTLASIAGRKGTVLVLYRSARWCPFCQAQLKDLKAAQAPLAQRGVAIAGLSYDSPQVLAGFAAKTGLSYPLLSDEKSVVIDALGLRDPAYAPGSFAHGVPKATILLIDAKGVVRWKSVSADYKVRPKNAEIIAAAGRLE